MLTASRPGVLVALALSLTACASLGGRMFPASEPDTRYTRAVLALDRRDYPAAREDLAWLVGRCEAGPTGRRALLLFASAELDVRNASGSAGEAARLARAYLGVSSPDDPDAPIARTLYLLAMDLVGAPGYVPHQVDVAEAGAVSVADRFDACDGTGRPQAAVVVPEPLGTTTGARIAGLRAELEARTDSLSQARAGLAAQAEKIQELEAEIERIRKLLRGGGGSTPSPRR
ncbi:MAG TPA: hypothetical protein VJ997_11890 [Longimicrobiales bacterium]|nr:hypothetical protein [Longimicrobiales bacterium]